MITMTMFEQLLCDILVLLIHWLKMLSDRLEYLIVLSIQANLLRKPSKCWIPASISKNNSGVFNVLNANATTALTSNTLRDSLHPAPPQKKDRRPHLLICRLSFLYPCPFHFFPSHPHLSPFWVPSLFLYPPRHLERTCYRRMPLILWCLLYSFTRQGRQ